MKNQSKTYEAQVIPATKEDHNKKALIIIGGILLLITIILLIARSGKSGIGIAHVMAQLEG